MTETLHDPRTWPSELTTLPIRKVEDGRRVITNAQVAALFRCTTGNVRQMVKAGRLSRETDLDEAQRTWFRIENVASHYYHEYPGAFLDIEDEDEYNDPSQDETEEEIHGTEKEDVKPSIPSDLAVILSQELSQITQQVSQFPSAVSTELRPLVNEMTTALERLGNDKDSRIVRLEEENEALKKALEEARRPLWKRLFRVQ